MTTHRIETFSDWFTRQTKERQEACLDNLRICVEYGAEQNRSPSSARCTELATEIRAYHTKWDTVDAATS